MIVLMRLLISCLLLTSICSTVYAQDYKNQKQLIKGADEAFARGDFKAAIPLYSNLVSSYPKDANYNFKYGASLLMGEGDKEKPIKYLQFAVSKPTVDPLAYYYYGLGLHLNYEFAKAIKYYKKFQNLGKPADTKAFRVDEQIVQCENGQTLLKTITDIVVLDKKELRDQDFYKVYDLTEFGGQILVKPEDFQTDYEKKNDVNDVFYFSKDVDIVFFSRKSTAEGDKDIFYKTRNPDGTLSRAVNIGKPINSKADDAYPFLHPDGQTLYFASKGHNSLGGYDIFVSKKDAEGNWSAPINLDFAINTPADDYLFITDKSGETAYFSSNRETQQGKVNVYQINMERFPLDFTFVYGTFESQSTSKANIKVVDAETKAIIGEYKTDENGKYKIKLPNDGTFDFLVDYEGSEVVHSGQVEIQGRDAFKPLKQTMEVMDQGSESERLVIKNLVDEEVEEDVALSADFLKNKAKLEVNVDEFKDRKKEEGPKLISEDGQNTSGSTSSDSNNELTDAGAEAGSADAQGQITGKAGASIAGEKTIEETSNTDGPTLVDTPENPSSGGTSGGSSSGGGAAVSATGIAVVAPKKLDPEKEPSNEEIQAIAQENKKALENDAEIYGQQASISRNNSAQYASEANEKRAKANDVMAGISEEDKQANSEEYQQAQALLVEADLLDRKAQTSEQLTQQMEISATKSKELVELNESYSAQMKNEANAGVNQQSYTELETQISENLSKQYDVGSLQEAYSVTAKDQQTAYENQQAMVDAMEAELEEIKEDISTKEKELETAKGKSKSELETQIEEDKADLKAEESNLSTEQAKADELQRKAALAQMDLDVVNELITQSQEDETIAELSKGVSNSSASIANTKAETSQSTSDLALLVAAGEGANTTSNSGSTTQGGSESSASNSSDPNSSEASSRNSSIAANGGQGDSQSSSTGGEQSNVANQTNSTAGSADVGNSSETGGSTAGQSNAGGASAGGTSSSNPVNTQLTVSAGVIAPSVRTEEGKSIESAVASSSEEWQNEEFDVNEALEIYEQEDMPEHDLAINPDSNSVQVSAFSAAAVNESLANDDQSIGSINGSGYSQVYMDKFMEVMEDEGSEYDKALKTYVINESWSADIEREISYLEAIGDQVPDEYQGNLNERIQNLKRLKESKLNNMQSSKNRVLDMATEQGTSEDLKETTNLYRAELVERINGSYLTPEEAEAKRQEDELLAAQSQSQSQTQPQTQSSNNNEGGDSNESTAQSTSGSSETAGGSSTNNGSTTGIEAGGAIAAGGSTSGNSDEGNNQGQNNGNSASAAGGDVEGSELAGTENTDSDEFDQGPNTSTSGSDGNAVDGATEATEGLANTGGAVEGSEISDSGSESNPDGGSNSSDSNTSTGNDNAGGNENSTESADNTASSNDATSGNDNGGGNTDVNSLNDAIASGGSSINSGNQGGSNNTANAANNSSNSNVPSNGNTSNGSKQNSYSVKGSQINNPEQKSYAPGQNTDRLAQVLEVSDKSMDDVVSEKTDEAQAQNETLATEVTEMESSLQGKQDQMGSAKRKEKKALTLEIENDQQALAEAKNQQEIAKYRSDALVRAADMIIALDEGEETESEKEVKRAESLKVEADDLFAQAETKEAEKVRGKKKKKAKAAEVKNLQTQGDHKLAEASASEELAKEMASLEKEVIAAYKNTPEELPKSEKRLSQAEVNEVRSSDAFQAYDKKRKEASVYYEVAQDNYVKAEQLENQNKQIRAQITELSAAEEAESDVTRINELQTEMDELEAKIETNTTQAEEYKKLAQANYSEYNHANNEAVRIVKSQDPAQQENLLAFVNQLEKQEVYAVAPTAGTSLANQEGEGYAPDAFTRVVRGIDDYPNELKDAIFDMIDYNKSLYDNDNPIPVDTELPGGIVYKVQIGAFRNPPPQDVFKGFAPVRGESTRPGWTRYTAGLFSSRDQAQLKRNEIRTLGYSDAFVVAYKDGKRISLTEADDLIASGYQPDPSRSAGGSTAGATGENVNAAPGQVIQLSNVQGLMYTVQVGAFRNPITSGELYGISPLVEYQQNGLYKYGSGIYNDRAKASAAQTQIQSLGVNDAFVTAFYNGRRVSMAEAANISATQGSGVFAAEQPIAVNNGSGQNIVLRVQVGAYQQEVPIEDAKIILSLSNLGIDVQQENGMTTYTVGRYSTYADANQIKESVIGQGLNGAFIVAYQNGERIEMQEALRILGQ